MTEPVLAARAAARRYGELTALAPTDFELRAGELVALVGPNGAGKSTLLALLAGALPPTSGSVERGRDVRIGWAPQRPAHYGRLSARENLELFARLEGLVAPRDAAERLLAAFDLRNDARPSSTLSVGNRQRLNVALALLGDPDVLVLDEPTSALDPAHRRSVLELAAATVERGGSVVCATQSLAELAGFADRVVALEGGRVVFDGSPEQYERAPMAEALA